MVKNIEQDLDVLRRRFESEPERPWRPRELAEALGFRGRRMQTLRQALDKLVRDGAIVELRPGVFGLGRAADLVTGKRENPYSYEHEYLVQKCLLEACEMVP